MKRLTIGRNPDNDIVMQYPQISGYHAEINLYDNGNITLIDHSTNGTIVNGYKINNQSIDVKRGDRIVFANQASLDWNTVISSGTVMMNGGEMNATFTSQSRYDQPYISKKPDYFAAQQLPDAPFAVVSLILGILSFPCGGFSGIVGLIFSINGQKIVSQNPNAYRNANLLNIARILSIVGISVWSVVYIILLSE